MSMAGKIDFKQITAKMAFSRRQKSASLSLWEDLEDKLLTPGQLLGFGVL